MEPEVDQVSADIISIGVWPPHAYADDSAPADEDTFDNFYRREMPRLVTLAGGLCGSAIAEDVAQEAMLAAYRNWGNANHNDHMEAWVRRVCVNLAVSQFRRKMVEARAVLKMSRRREPTALPATHEEFWTQLRRLPRRQAQAAALRYVYELSVHDIALTLECSEGTVKAHLSRARHALLGQLDLSADGEQ